MLETVGLLVRGGPMVIRGPSPRSARPGCCRPQAGSVAVGLALAQVLPEPPNRYHPVAWFGSTMERAERRRYRDDRARGVPQHTAIGAAIGGPRPGSRAACSSARRP